MKRLTILFLFVVMVTSMFATGRSDKQQRLSAQEYREKQKTFITERARLTSNEADKFFPLFFEMQDKKKEMNDEVWNLIKKSNKADMTEEQYEKLLDEIYDTRIAIDELEKSYLTKYRQFLTNKKLFEIQKADMRFHREMIKSVAPAKGGAGGKAHDKK